MKWLKAKDFCINRRPKNLWLKRRKEEEADAKRKEDAEQMKINNPMKDNLFPFSGPYKSTFPFEGVYSDNTGPGIKMDPEHSVHSTTMVP